jgi:hypothetical protein
VLFTAGALLAVRGRHRVGQPDRTL